MSFKDFYKANINKLIIEGGLAGHMSHPYDVLSSDEMIEFFEKLLSGNINATEKVDGVNLFVGLNNAHKLVYARNQSEPPSTDIQAKFPLQHPGGDAFRAGFKALKTAIEKLSKKDLIAISLLDEDGNPCGFYNLEIIYGEIPNLIQYSDTTNYIVFHSIAETPDKQYIPKEIEPATMNKMLKLAAQKLGEVDVESDVVGYYGDMGKITRATKIEKSHWVFKSQIEIPAAKIKQELTAIAQKFKKYPELQILKNKGDYDDDRIKAAMKSVAAKVGSEILINLSSELFTGRRKTSTTHPKIEGLVTPYKNSLIKITGDFAQLNQNLWRPLKDGLDRILKEVIGYVLNNVLEIPNISSIVSKSWTAADVKGVPESFLKIKNKIYIKQPELLTAPINKNDIITRIEKAFEDLRIEHDKMLKDTSNVKQEDIIRALRIGGFKLQEFRDSLKTINNRTELLRVLATTMFGL